jgi:hypothetical protein
MKISFETQTREVFGSFFEIPILEFWSLFGVQRSKASGNSSFGEFSYVEFH